LALLTLGIFWASGQPIKVTFPLSSKRFLSSTAKDLRGNKHHIIKVTKEGVPFCEIPAHMSVKGKEGAHVLSTNALNENNMIKVADGIEGAIGSTMINAWQNKWDIENKG